MLKKVARILDAIARPISVLPVPAVGAPPSSDPEGMQALHGPEGFQFCAAGQFKVKTARTRMRMCARNVVKVRVDGQQAGGNIRAWGPKQ